MPTLNKISFYQYKNYASKVIELQKPIICITGKNGSGKTNLLDAIYFLCFTKSYLHHKDLLMVAHQANGMNITGEFLLDKPHELYTVKCIIRETQKKEWHINDQELKKVQEHIGKLPSIFISPSDIYLVLEGSEYRRKFLDATICQENAAYFADLMMYNKYLAQRNALLKNWIPYQASNEAILEVYNQEMANLGAKIFAVRAAFVQQLIPLINYFYTHIGKVDYQFDIQYKSHLQQDDLLTLFTKNKEKDILLKRTTAGIHRDDLVVYFSNQQLFKEIASQGQVKTLLFAFKLAQYQYLKTTLHTSPILLLDDIFEKLDETRSLALIDWICHENCQVFITDTHKGRCTEAFAQFLDKVQMIEIS